MTLMLRPVSCANCSRMCRVGLGVALKAAFNVSNCLALIVVLGPLRFDPAVEFPFVPSIASSPDRLLSGVTLEFGWMEFPFVSQLCVLWFESEDIFNNDVSSSLSGSGLDWGEFIILLSSRLLFVILLFARLLWWLFNIIFSFESMSWLSPSILKSLSDKLVCCSKALSKSPSSSISDDPGYMKNKKTPYVICQLKFIIGKCSSLGKNFDKHRTVVQMNLIWHGWKYTEVFCKLENTTPNLYPTINLYHMVPVEFLTIRSTN